MNLKPSRYNLATHRGDQFFLFNTNSLSSVALDGALAPRLSGLLRELTEAGHVSAHDAGTIQVLELLRAHRFIVDRDSDEFAEIRKRYAQACADGTLRLTIVPTLSCNMQCYYCYEGADKNSRKWALGPAQLAYIVEFASQRLKPGGSLIVHWFGGEPLLQKQSIYRLSGQLMDMANRRGAAYSAWITSNGYNLDVPTAIRLKECNVRKIQVTLDGAKPYHDRIRFVGAESARRGSYDKIVDNILAAADMFKFVLRLHVSPSSIESFLAMTEDLAARGVPSKVAYAAIHLVENFDPLRRDKAHQPISGQAFSTREFAEMEVDLMRVVHGFGFKLKSPFAHVTGCMVDHENSYLIDADGSIKQCDHYVGAPGSEYSHIATPGKITNIDNLERWNLDRFADLECMECAFFPICLQGCLHKVIDSSAKYKDCPTIRHNWREVLPFFYEVGSHC